MMDKQYPEITKDILRYLREIKPQTPEFMQAWAALAPPAFKDGALDKKTKELIALAIGVASRCDGCIGFHSEALVKLGATRKELAEMLAVSVYMGGGPSLMTAAEAMKAFMQFETVSGALQHSRDPNLYKTPVD